MDHPSPHLTHASALVQLLTTHPDLPPATSWQVRDGLLYGSIQAQDEAGFDLLRAYADALGGGISPGPSFQAGGRGYGRHELTTTWCGVRLTVSMSLPVRDDAENAALATQDASQAVSL